MEIRLLKNEEFLQLVNLNAKMYEEIDPTINAVGATASLVKIVTTEVNPIAIGLFLGEHLQGFVTGYAASNNVFHFSGIYVIIKNNEWTKKLIDFSFAFIKDKGYSAWRVHATKWQHLLDNGKVRRREAVHKLL